MNNNSKLDVEKFYPEKTTEIMNIIELEKQNENFDTKYQNITYYMVNREKVVQSEDNVEIDFLKAMNEMKNLDWKDKSNFIGFTNNNSEEIVQFIRQNENEWYAEIPIRHGKNWEGYAWCAYSDSKTVTNMVRLFFEEVPWFGMLSWKMRRFGY